jgi:hypothetical protein
MRPKDVEYVVQTRSARVRVWSDLANTKPFKRHKDALDLAKRLTKEPRNRGHDHYYRVQRRTKGS